ncbi:MAG: metallophosphoesterase [Mucispirillum sp.]|uniref:Metallophosphoesterase n=1 Tax=Candidatus Mucispirillum faecigallinarum TaxID=2838699 RepID=A0A9D2KBH4_9BACT|nr:metallophosphoesterase [Mucispirillum sp.]HIZ88777.1 metallophosphoesterase [Candidatus Mucispirillum faecigallinarum]
MKNILKKSLFIISILAVIFIILSIFLYFYTRHHLNFNPENKDIEKAVIYGDVRSGYLTHIKIANMVAEEKPDMIIFTGDIASNSRNYIHYLQHTIFERKLWNMAEYYPVRGNHESTYWLYDAFFDLPNDKSYYSFDRMGMHFIVLDCWNVYKPLEEKQMQWLKEDLEKNKNKPISVAMHVPLFTSGKYEPYNEPDLLALFDKYNVLFVFSAHVHSYEHSLYKGTNYIVTAGGGAPLYPVTRDNPYKVVRENVHHYTVLTRDNDTYTLKAIDINGNIIDTVSTSLQEVIKAKENQK